jgi:hypothetical protein
MLAFAGAATTPSPRHTIVDSFRIVVAPVAERPADQPPLKLRRSAEALPKAEAGRYGQLRTRV